MRGSSSARSRTRPRRSAPSSKTRFARQIYPVLTPLAVGPGQPFPYISGLTLSLGVTVRDPDSGEERFARVKVPETLPRFVSIGDRGLSVPLEGVISHHLSWVFPGMELTERAAFRVTRDGDTEISDDADDLLEAVETELRKRRFGAVVRLEVSSSISRAMVARLTERLAVRPDAVYPIHGLLDLREVIQLYDLDRPDLKYEPWAPQTQRRLAKPKDGDLFSEIAASDIVVQHPYDSFATSVETFVRDAAKDPAVATLKTTVYRTSLDSALAPALIEAAEEGKQSVCIVELKARFDERRNIEWARSLEQAGVHVVYGFPDLKIHAKTTLVIRREGDSLQRYAHIGTGNYNATTARIYEDVGLFTADPDITADIADLFNFVTGFGRPRTFRKILVAPFNLRRELTERIRAVGAAATAGEHARIRIKVNNIADPQIVEELYKASQAGAEIDLIVRAVCVLRPGIEGLSERIRVRSILGRFLEHSRLYCFEAGETKSYLLGSADLMPRNLDHRIEMIVPVEAAHVRAEIETIFRRLLSDNSQAWTLEPRRNAGTGSSPSPASGGAPRSWSRCAAACAPGGARRPGPEAPTCGAGHHGGVPVGVIDVGSNTVRLHVAEGGTELYREKAMLRLGEPIERTGGDPGRQAGRDRRHGHRISSPSRADTAPSGPRCSSRARAARRANGAELIARLTAESGVPVRLLSPQEEGRLAFIGAIAATRRGQRALIAVCDVGGGSSQVAVGTRRDGVAWVRSVDIGSMRLTSRLLGDDPPGDAAVARARAEIEPPARGLRAAGARAGARRRRQRPRDPLDRRAGARPRRARRGRRDPRPDACGRDRRSSTTSTPTACGRSRPGPSSSRRCRPACTSRFGSSAAAASARARRSSSPPGAKPPEADRGSSVAAPSRRPTATGRLGSERSACNRRSSRSARAPAERDRAGRAPASARRRTRRTCIASASRPGARAR